MASVSGTAGRTAPVVQAVRPAATTAAARNCATTLGFMTAGYGARHVRVALLLAGTGEQPAWTVVSAERPLAPTSALDHASGSSRQASAASRWQPSRCVRPFGAMSAAVQTASRGRGRQRTAGTRANEHSPRTEATTGHTRSAGPQWAATSPAVVGTSRQATGVQPTRTQGWRFPSHQRNGRPTRDQPEPVESALRDQRPAPAGPDSPSIPGSALGPYRKPPPRESDTSKSHGSSTAGSLPVNCIPSSVIRGPRTASAAMQNS